MVARGIDMVRDRIKHFAQKKVTLPQGRHKIIILDEADRYDEPHTEQETKREKLMHCMISSMTGGAQQALRRTMEIYSNTTRFVFACNQSNKIIEPIQSRCAILRYNKLTDAEVLSRLQDICKRENVDVTNDGMEALIFTADGDMRQAINNLQSTYYGFKQVNAQNVYKVCDEPHPAVLQRILTSCADGNVKEADRTMRDLYDLGYSSLDIITTLSRVLKNMRTLEEGLRLDLLKASVSNMKDQVMPPSHSLCF